jgi:ribosomal protein L12E/L44/L45/RPP1/RPP2
MASSKDRVSLTDDDFKRKSFKTAPAGKYTLKISNASKIKPGAQSNILQVVLTITKGPHKGVNIFDNIAAHVGWKVAQLMLALGIKKKKITLQELLKLITGKTLQAVISTGKFNDKKQNKVAQYLPAGKAKGDEDESDEDEDEDEDEQDEDEDEDDADEDEDGASDDDDDDDDDDEDDDDDADDDEADEDEDDDEDADDDAEDNDEEDEPAPVKRGKKPAGKKPALKKSAAKKVVKKGRK